MRLMLLGAPGAGKGTQAKKLMAYFQIPQISTGDMLRAAVAAGSALGKEVKSVMDAGQLVSDTLIMQLVKERLKEADCQNGYLLDGFPRTLAQAKAMREADLRVDHVIELIVPDEEIILRLSGRRIHAHSGRVYHTVFHPPRVPDCDDETGEPLIQRDDDQEATVRHRLEVYHAQTKPLVSYYQAWQATNDPQAPQFHQLPGVGDVAVVFQNILKMMQESV